MRGVEQIPLVYDAMMSVMDATGLRRWRQWLVRGATGRTLEVGCGTGRNLPLYAANQHVIGCDPSRDAIKKARARSPGTPLVIATAEALPFKDGAFDTVVSSLVFCSVSDVPRGLAEVRRVLKRGGILRMLEHVRSTKRLGARWQDAVQPLWTKVAGGCHPNRDTEGAVERAGFRIDPAERKAHGTMRRFLAK